MIESPQRICHDAIDVTGYNDLEYIRTVIEHFSLVLVMGYSCTGKTSTITEALVDFYSRPVIYWNRQKILDMLFYNRVIENDSIHGVIGKAEMEMIEYQYSRTPRCRVVLDGWYRMESNRRMSHKCLGISGISQPSAVLVFDGPQHLIAQRIRNDPRYVHMIDAEIELDVRDKIKTTSWPTLNEGWDHIIYVNTFGEEGAQYLQNTLRQI